MFERCKIFLNSYFKIKGNTSSGFHIFHDFLHHMVVPNEVFFCRR
jgi:hypothetical protein